MAFDRSIVDRVLDAVPGTSLVFPYGSRVYGTHTPRSDHDFIVVCSDRDARNIARERINSRNTDIHVFSTETFQGMLDDHEVSALECFFLPDDLKFRNRLPVRFTLDRSKLREAFSRKSNHSWVKAKKKLIVPEDRDEYIAKKSLFHCLRILDFGAQIGSEGRIHDYGRVNHLLGEIMACDADWDVLDGKYRPSMLAAASLFREFAPKK